MKKDFIYFDSAAAARPHPRLGEWYAEALEQHWLNPHGGTCYAEACRRVALAAERRLLACLQIPEGGAHVIWTSGVTEAMNLAIFGAADSVRCIADTGGHAALRRPAEALAAKGLIMDFAALDRRGQLQLEPCREKVLLAVSQVNNETGAIQDLPRLRGLCPAGLLAVDAAQGFGKIHIPWREARIDCLALSSRKLGGPASVGALVVRQGHKLSPQMLGGGQQGGLRSGTVDVIGAELFVRVAEEHCRNLAPNQQKVRELSRAFWSLLDGTGRPWVRISPEDGSPWIAMLAFSGYEGAVVSRILAEQEGIVLSSSSACSAETHETSPGLAGMGFSPEIARCALRVSFAPENSLEEVRALVDALARCFRNY